MHPELSTTALQLHLCAALVSAQTDRTGFVPDGFLDTIDDDITLAVLELCAADLWMRGEDGFQIPPQELRRVIEMLKDLHQHQLPLK